MILVELALQGVLGFPGVRRMAFRPGLNVGKTKDRNARAAFFDLAYHCLYPEMSRAEATARWADRSAKSSMAALIFFGRDKITYRILRDVATGATQLFKFNPSDNKYTLLTNASAEVAQYVRSQQQIPDDIVYERLFMLTPEAMPSLGASARTRSGAPIVRGAQFMTPSGPGLPGAARSGAHSGPAASAGRFAPPASPHGRAPTPGVGSMPGSHSSGVMPSPLFGGGAGLDSKNTGFGSSMNMTNVLVQTEMEGGPAMPVDELAEKKATLKRLRGELDVVAKGEEAQIEIDQLNTRRIELVSAGERIQEVAEEIERLKKQAVQDNELGELPPGFTERLKRFEELEDRFRLEAGRMNEEIGTINDEFRSMNVGPLWRNAMFLAGLGGAVAAVGAAIAVGRPSIAFANVLGIAISAGAAFRWVSEVEAKARVEVKLSAARDRMDRMKKNHELDSSVVRRLMEKFKVGSPEELLERVEGRGQLLKHIQATESKLQAMRSDPAVVGAEKEISAIEVRIAECEKIVLDAQGSMVSAEALRRRVALLERELVAAEMSRPARPAPGAMSPAAGLSDEDDEEGYGGGYGSGTSGGKGPSKPGGGHGMLAAAASGGGSFGGGGFGGGYGSESGAYLAPDRSRELMQAATDLLQVPIDELCQGRAPRLGQYLSALTDGRFKSASFGPRGEVSVVPGAGGAPVAYDALDAETLDLVDSAIRLCLVEACAQKCRVPLLVDDPFTQFPARRRTLFVQMLGHLAQGAQVIALTDADDLKGNAFEV